jgi:hypothetical protein
MPRPTTGHGWPARGPIGRLCGRMAIPIAPADTLALHQIALACQHDDVVIKLIMHKATPGVNDPVLSQPQFCLVSGLDMVATNNLLARHQFESDEIGGRHIKGATRLFSIPKAWQGRLISDAIQRQQFPIARAVEIADVVARLAAKNGWLQHWAKALEARRPLIPGFAVVAWLNDCYDAYLVEGDQKTGLPILSSIPKRFLPHPYLMLPLSAPFIDVWQKCLAILDSERT